MINSANVGSGNSTVNFTVQPFNVSDGMRHSTITIADQTFYVIQGAPFISRTMMDFEGDGRSDYVAIQKSNNSMIWHINQSHSGYRAQNFGLFADDIPVSRLAVRRDRRQPERHAGF
jgi:hypothetical protein